MSILQTTLIPLGVFGFIIFYFLIGNFCDDSDYEDSRGETDKTYIDSRGYRRFKNSGSYVHRWVAEKYVVGRRLRRGEVVHHLDGNKLNNDPDNLEVMWKDEHDEEHGFEWD